MPSLEDENYQDFKISDHTISMTDLYCIFNRARGTELISPDDLLEACKQFEYLNLPMRIEKLHSGCLVIVSKEHDEQKNSLKVAQLVEKLGCITSLELSTLQRISLPLSIHYLEMAEKMEYLCRDDSFQGLIFYPNRFNNHMETV